MRTNSTGRSRFPPILLACGLLAGSFLMGSCGTTADDRAAVVGDRVVNVDSVDALARELEATQGGSSSSDSFLAGTSARDALSAEIQVAAAQHLADLWGAEVTDADRAAAEKQAASSSTPSSGELKSAQVAYGAALSALKRQLESVDPSDVAAQRKLYDSAPSLWDQVCLAAVSVPSKSAAEVAEAVAGGTKLEQVPDEVQGATPVVDPSQPCVQRSQLPAAVLDAVKGSIGQTVGPLTLAAGSDDRFFVRADSAGTLTFDKATDQLKAILSSLTSTDPQANTIGTYLTAVANDMVEVNPRYGDGVSLSSGRLSVVAPPVPKGWVAPTPTPAASTGEGTQSP